MTRQFDTTVAAWGGGAECMGNIAVGKRSSASSEAFGGLAWKGNDGNTNGNYGGGSCTHTQGGPSWWQVDLAGVYNISSVEIYHRSGMCGSNPCAARGANSKVYISDTPDYSTGSMCDMEGYTTETPSSEISCNMATAQYVTIAPVVTVCEVEVNVPLHAGRVDTQPCNTETLCPIDCEGYWRSWSLCSETCEGGTQTRYFEVTTPNQHGGLCPETDAGTQEQECNTQPCPIDCVGEWQDWSDCSLACGGGVQTRGFTITQAAQFDGICTHEGVTQEQACNQIPCSPDGTPAEIVLADGLELQANLQYDLPFSAPNMLATLWRVEADAREYEVGRSYDANEWEGVPPTPLSFDCSAGDKCQVVLPADGSGGDVYRIDVIERDDSRTDDMILAQFLMSATFGQTRASIDQIRSMGSTNDERITNWLDAQMSLPAGLHRAYWRRNVNTPVSTPNRQSGPSHPCQENSLWHRFAFSERDQGRIVDVTETTEGYSLSINGVVRTEVAAADVDFSGAEPPYYICKVNMPAKIGVGGHVAIGNSDTCDSNAHNNVLNDLNGAPLARWEQRVVGPVNIANPAISFSTEPDGAMILSEADAVLVDGADPDTKVIQALNVVCPLTDVGPEDETYMRHGDTYYRHIPTSRFLENTLENPMTTPPDSFAFSPRLYGDSVCPNVPKTFLNRDTCVRRPECVGPLEYSDTELVLDEATILAMYSTSANRHVHYVDGLEFQRGQRSGYNPFDPAMPDLSGGYGAKGQIGAGTLMVSPCAGSSRWRSSPGACAAETALGDDTKASIRSAIQTSEDTNPLVKDLVTIAGVCSGDDVIGAAVTVGDQCWEHTHPANLNVIDFTQWTVGNAQVQSYFNTIRESPTAKYAWNNEAAYMFSLEQDGAAWNAFINAYTRIYQDMKMKQAMGLPTKWRGAGWVMGRLGDTISFNDLTPEFQTPEFAAYVGATVVGGGEYDGTEACGSPGEAASDASLGMNYGSYGVGRLVGDVGATQFYKDAGQRIKQSGGDDKSNLFTNVVVKADDQLRQRVAWAFAQQHVVSRTAFPRIHSSEGEMWPQYMDIFVRNAFGNFRDIMREVAYSPMQGKYLTFLRSIAYAASGKYPDENFAREFMQLFTIGVNKLNSDGTMQVDADGRPLETYANRDIMNFARLWTGFVAPRPRNNKEDRWENGDENIQDPMGLQPRWRDPWPKTDLFGGHIGDGTPVCSDLPEQMFLRPGATYVYRGYTEICSASSVLTGGQGLGGCSDNTADMPRGHYAGSVGAIALSDTSALRQQLCAVDADGACAFPSVVTLAVVLPCDGDECDVETLKQVKVETATEVVFYEYEPPPCVNLAFYNDAKRVRASNQWNKHMCANPLTAAASSSCCNAPDNPGQPAMSMCNYRRERTTYAEAERRCAAIPDLGIIQYPGGAAWQKTYEPLPGGGVGYFMAVDPGGNPDLSECRIETDPLEVRCCSDTQVGSLLSPAGVDSAEAAANVALGRPCTQSSVHGGGVCERAFDGNTDGAWAGGSVIHTGRGGVDQYVQVDLGADTLLEGVTVYFRTDCCAGRQNGATIKVSSTPDYSAADAVQCGGQFTHAGIATGSQTLSCPGVTGRYVTLYQFDMFIHISEMQVMAAHTETCSTAFPDGMPFSSASLDNAVTQAQRVPDAPLFAVQEGPCGSAYEPILTLEECQAAQDYLPEIAAYGWLGGRDAPTEPGVHWIEGCSHRNTQILFHELGATSTTGWGSNWAPNLRSICKLTQDVDTIGTCVRARTKSFAEQVCEAEGARLCTQAEVAAECVSQAPCTYRQDLMWTSDTCVPPDTMAVCQNYRWVPPAAQPETECGQEDWMWTSDSCNLQVNVNADGGLNVVHDVPGVPNYTPGVGNGYVVETVRLDHIKSLMKWDVQWVDGLFPDPTQDCFGSSDCQVHEAEGQAATCLCSVSVEDTAPFTDMAALPSRDDVMSRLKIGAASPAVFDAGTYTQCVTAECAAVADVQIWTTAGVLDTDTIFAVEFHTETRYFLNKESAVGFSGFSFRNPPQFAKWDGMTLDTDVRYETEALFDSLLHHPNTAPHTAKSLIQRFVTSNPSTRYVSVVSEAFSTGTYAGRTYSGKYGDLAATVAAMLLDRESRSAAVKADLNHGMLREPYASLIHVFRAMEYQSPYEISMEGLRNKIGQEPYNSPSVFNFYSPTYSPTGKVADAGLVSPEAELLSAPNTVGLFNGLHALVDYGLSGCNGGFSAWYAANDIGGVDCNHQESAREGALGLLSLPPPEDRTAESVVDQLDLLLTGGRLSPATRASIIESVDAAHYRNMYMVAHGAGLVNPVTGDTGLASYCAASGEIHDVACCSDERDTHGDLPYGMGHRFAECAAVTNPLWVGSWVLEGCGDCPNNGCKNACCIEDVEFQEAQATCAADNARMCTVEELEAGCASYNGCGHGGDFLWSNTPCEVDATEDAQRLAAKLILGTSEFKTTADNRQKATPRVPLPAVESQGRPYKAVVLIYLSGGADTHNLVVPHSNCDASVGDLYAQYQEVRGVGEGGVALMPNQLLPIALPDGTQVCNTFGMHHKLVNLKQMWDAGDLSFYANVGCMIEPLTKDEYRAKTKRIPSNLGSHAHQTQTAQSVWASYSGAKGILGRMVDALMSQDNAYRSASYSIWGNQKAVHGYRAPTFIHFRRGIAQFRQYGQIARHYQNISGLESMSIFADTWAEALADTLVKSRSIADQYAAGSTTESFGINCPSLVTCNLADQLKSVAQMMSSRALTENEREVYLVSMGTWDYHQDTRDKFSKSLEVVDASIAAFKREMDHQGLWDNVVLLISSDFGRTLTSNGLGTDHAWGGNYFAVGGSINGGQMLGVYPSDLREGNPLDSGRGRMIPTMPWEGMWHGVAQWMDIAPEKILEVLPDAANFEAGTTLTTREQAFVN
eukprot:COSAG02_NODE_2_length_75708_cov_87.013953_9_plen_2901_part_00